MYRGKRFLGLVPARGGSKGVPRKNIRELAGKPLIAWTLEAAQASAYLDACIVSTEDGEIAATAEGCGAEVLHRPLELAGDATPGIEVVLHAMKENPSFDYVVLLQPTSPLRIAEDIDGCIGRCLEEGAPFCVSITEPSHSPYWMYTLGDDRRLSPLLELPEEQTYQRQKLPKVYQLNGAVYVGVRDALARHRSFMTPETIGYVMPEERSHDIDTLLDFRIAGMLLEEEYP